MLYLPCGGKYVGMRPGRCLQHIFLRQDRWNPDCVVVDLERQGQGQVHPEP